MASAFFFVEARVLI